MAGLCLRERHARLEARDHCQPDSLVVVQIVKRRPPRDRPLDHADRNEDTRLVAADG